MSIKFEAGMRARDFNVQFDVDEGEGICLLGHNGSGKSTLLGLLAGTLRPDWGYAAVGDLVIFDIAKGAAHGKWMPPYDRRFSLLSQDPLLFPHLNVLDNVAFGPRSQGKSKKESALLAQQWLDRVGVGDLSGRAGASLSGGQAGRVALARALAAEPALLLLDEPLAAMDVEVVPEVRRTLRHVLRGRSSIMATHDLMDALVLSDTAVALERGRTVEQGPTRSVLSQPRTYFTAGLAGLNMVQGRYQKGAVISVDGIVVAGQPPDGARPDAGDEAAAVFSPAAVAVYLAEGSGSPRNAIPVVVSGIEPQRGVVRVFGNRGGQTLTADVTAQSAAELDLHLGQAVLFVIKATQVTVYGL